MVGAGRLARAATLSAAFVLISVATSRGERRRARPGTGEARAGSDR